MRSRRAGMLLSNIIALIISYFVAYHTRFGRNWTVYTRRNLYTIALLLIVSFLVVFLIYPQRKPTQRLGILGHLQIALLYNILMAMLFITLMYVVHLPIVVSRLFIGYFFLVNFVLMFAIMQLFAWLENKYNSRHRKKTVIFANEDNALQVVHNFLESASREYEISGIVVISGEERKLYKICKNEKKHTYIKENEEMDVKTFLKRDVIDLAIIALPMSSAGKIRKLVRRMEKLGIDAMLTLDSFAINEGESCLEQLGDMQVIRYAPRIFTDKELLQKRVLDIIGGIVGCIFCIIIGIFVAPAIFIEDPGPVIFKQKRVGKNGRYFMMYKFRSMYQDAEERKKELMKENEMDGLMFKMKDDPRITKVGKFIRKTSLDEFPQFFNVLFGSMSLVGTRPPTVDEYQQYSSHHKRRLSLKPGITGLWQVSGRSDITDFEEVVRLDLQYIDHWSMKNDIKILLKTVGAVFTGKGSE